MNETRYHHYRNAWYPLLFSRFLVQKANTSLITTPAPEKLVLSYFKNKGRTAKTKFVLVKVADSSQEFAQHDRARMARCRMGILALVPLPWRKSTHLCLRFTLDIESCQCDWNTRTMATTTVRIRILRHASPVSKTSRRWLTSVTPHWSPWTKDQLLTISPTF